MSSSEGPPTPDNQLLSFGIRYTYGLPSELSSYLRYLHADLYCQLSVIMSLQIIGLGDLDTKQDSKVSSLMLSISHSSGRSDTTILNNRH